MMNIVRVSERVSNQSFSVSHTHTSPVVSYSLGISFEPEI